MTIYSFCSRWGVLSLALSLPVSLSAQNEAAPAEIKSAIDAVSARVLPSLVRIEVLMEQGNDGRMVKQRGFGSGTVITPEGHVLTNHHVAGRGTRFLCTMANREEIPAKLIGTDVLSDLAIIQLDLSARRDPDAPIPVATFGDSSKLKVGDTVFALGSPAALSQSVTQGIVSNTEMIAPKSMGGFSLDGESVGELVRWIGHDAVIFGGNSGGPLVDTQGHIIGINEVGIGSLGGAIPGNLAKSVGQELIAKGEVERGWIGLEIQPLLRTMKDRKGALVASVFIDSPAEKAGVRPGDFLHTVNGLVIPDCRSPEDLPVFNALVLNTHQGEVIKLTGERDGKPMDWEVAVLKREPTRGFEKEYPLWGMTARDLTPMSAIEMKRDNNQGVQVHSVRPGGPAAEAKPPLSPLVVITHLDNKPINSIAEFDAFLADIPEDLEEPRPVLVAFERGVAHEKLLTVVKIGPERKAQDPLTADRGWLGTQVQELGKELADALNLKGKSGVRITRIAEASPAKGILELGDILTKLDGKVLPVRRPEDIKLFSNMINSRSPETEVKFEVQRGGETLEKTVMLAAQPQDEDDAKEYREQRLEFTARDLTPSTRDSLQISADLKAVRIVNVVANGWSSLAGLRNGDLLLSVDGAPMENVDALEAKLKETEDAKASRIVLFVKRGVRHLFLEVEPSNN